MATRPEKHDEPMGIVISRGSREEPVPRFTLYVWGPAPDAVPSAKTQAA